MVIKVFRDWGIGFRSEGLRFGVQGLGESGGFQHFSPVV